jgi:hypothetical protein
VNAKGETMERLDVGGMTLEGFFLAEYQRLRQENEELRRKVEGVGPNEYGLFDLGKKTECVRVSVTSRNGYGIERDGITSDALRKALEMGDDELWEWATKPRRHLKHPWYSPFRPVEVERTTFDYTLRIRETRSDCTWVTDANPNDDESKMYPLKEWEGEDCLDVWQDADRFDYIKAQAIEKLRAVINSAIPNVESEEKKAAE